MAGTVFTIPSIFTAVDKFSGPMRNMGNAVQGFVGRSERLLGRANMAFSRLLAPITSLNKMLMGLGFYVGLFTLVRIIKNAIDIFANFQQANTDLAVVMGTTAKKNKILADDARRIGLAYGEAATDVVKMQHALATLGFEQSSILKMGRPLITGAAALEGADPKKLADIVGAMINTFDNLDDSNTQHILDVMALSANRTALNFEKLATTLPIVAGPANALGITFEQVVALLGTLQNAGIHVATSATSLKNIFIDSQKRGHTYSQMLDNVANNTDKLTYAYDKFGKRSVVSALVLAQKLKETAGLTKELQNAKLGLTEDIAIERINTFRGAQKLLNAAYQEFILAIEDGNGPIAQALVLYMKTAAALLLLSSDSDQAREALTKMDSGIIASAKRWKFWIKLILWASAALIAAKIILFAWSAAIGIANIAMQIWTGLTYAMTGAQWLLNAAMAANPIGLIIIAIAALLALITASIAKYDEWGSGMLSLMGPLGLMVHAVMTIAHHWEKIMSSFEASGWRGGIVSIFQMLTDLILYPLQQILQVLGRITGADWAINAANDIEAFRDKINSLKVGDDGRIMMPIVNPKATDDEVPSAGNQNLKGRVDVHFNDPFGFMKFAQSDSSFVVPHVSPTNTFGR